MNWPFGNLKMFGYDVLDVDPPWHFELYDTVTGGKKSAHAQYACMPLDEIKALPVNQLAARDCLLTLWTCGWAMARGDALDVCRAWGATPISEVVWRKVFASGKVAMGPGYRVRTMHEPILLATWGNPEHKPFPSIFDGVRREHSEKPDEWYEMLVRHTPSALRRACLFSAGRRRPGFDCWGEPHALRKKDNGKADRGGGYRPLEPPLDRRRERDADLFEGWQSPLMGDDLAPHGDRAASVRVDVAVPAPLEVGQSGGAAQSRVEGGEHGEAACTAAGAGHP